MQQMQQTDRIGPSRNGDSDPVSRREHPVIVDVRDDPFGQEAFHNMNVTILPYWIEPACFVPPDAAATDAARCVIEFLKARIPGIAAEHVGSTAVEGCGGKGILDLMILYPAGHLEAVREMLDQLGFQRQTGRDPFPEERPMRVGAVKWRGKLFRIHAHVIQAESPEAKELRGFRNQLRADDELKQAYVAKKQAILEAGITDSLDYCAAKGEFVEASLRTLE
jgi:GrpB-like predicted nucleotidyltransferase (UPF0157 family)